MRTRKVVKKNTVNNKSNHIKLFARGRNISQRVTIINIKLPADRTQPRMLGFNPYEYAIKIPAQAPPTMVSQIVNQHSAVETLVKSVQTEQQKQQPKQETSTGPSGLSDEETEIFFNKRPREDMDSAFGSSTPNVSEFRNPGEASGSRTSLRKNIDDLQQKLNMFDSKHKKLEILHNQN